LGSSKWYSGYSAQGYEHSPYYEDEDFEGYGKVGKSYPSTVTSGGLTTEVKGSYVPDTVIPTSREVKPFVKAAYNQWQRRGYAGIEQWVKDAPHKAAALISYWYDDVDGVTNLVEDDPDEAACWIADLFRTDSVTPSLLD
jgi:hypothetical protein